MYADNSTLIIGHKGYIGSYLYNYLSNKGFSVVGVGERIEDYNDLSSSFLSNFRNIVLLAGHSSVKMCEGDLKSPWLNNVVNFKNLLEKKPFGTNLIYGSSASVYGNSNCEIFEEKDISLDYVNNYDLTKVSLDLYSLKEIQIGQNIIGLRFGTVNGGSKTIRKDLMINSMVYNAIQNGNIYISNKEINRPILALSDLGRAIETIIKHYIIQPGLYNLASFNSTVEEISTVVSNKTGVPVIDNGNTSNVYNFSIDTTKFKTKYQFEFKENVESVVDDVIRCYTKKPNVVTRDKYFEYNG